MGQRLVIQIKDSKGERLATQYMHWSGYTGSTLEIARNLHDELESRGPIREEPEFAVQLLRAACTGAALTKEAELALGTKETRALNRNDGLIDVTPEEMQESVSWEEASLEIILDSKGGIDATGYYTDVFWQYEDIKEFIEELGDPEAYKLIEEDPNSKELKWHNEKEKRWEYVPCYQLTFDGYPETWKQMKQLTEIYDATYSDGWAFCVQDLDDEGKEKRYFIMQWIG